MNKFIRSTLLIAVLFSFLPSKVYAEESKQPLRLITVSGEAEVRVAPDEVVITLGVETWNNELSIAKSENDQRVKKIIETARKHKIEDKYIQTDQVSIEPRYQDQWEHQKFAGYFVRKTIALTLKDMSQFDFLLSGVLESGANYVHGVQFNTTELRKHRDQARTLAIRAAQEKANALAKEVGMKVGPANSIQENRSGWQSWYSSWWGYGRGGGKMQNTIQNVEPSASNEGSAALGQIDITASVQVVFELSQ